MRFVPLGSGSRGNAALVEIGPTRLLVDAGLSARALKLRLELIGVDPAKIDGILLTHEHQDHARGAQRFSSLHGVPVIASPATLDELQLSPAQLAGWIPLPADGRIRLGEVDVEAFPVPHDAANPVGFVLRGDGKKIGIATDLGQATSLVVERLRGCHVLMVESNHDEAMLRDGGYPWHLKQRVSGRFGHLSNVEAADLIRRVVDQDCQAIVLAHLSDQNNRPELARRTAAQSLARVGLGRIQMRIAAAGRPTPPVVLP